MNIESIFRLTGLNKERESKNIISRINKFLKTKVGTGVGFIAVIIIVYLIVSLFTIYNLLVSF